MNEVALTNQSHPTVPALVLIGAYSRAGRAVFRAWPGNQIVPIHRGDGPGVKVPDYLEVPEGAIPPGSVVVNCVGSPRGTEDALLQLNRDVALRWAQAAAAAGASHFIQLSSFSVYGNAEHIDHNTTEAPLIAYGRSKLAADRALSELHRNGFSVTLLRIPMLFGDGSDKLAQLVKAVRMGRIVPAVTPPIERSMLSYDGLAAAIVELARRPIGNVVLVADPTVFTYELLRDRIAAVTGRAPHRIKVPPIAGAAIQRLDPALHARLFASSRLAPASMLQFTMPPNAGLQREIDRLAGL